MTPRRPAAREYWRIIELADKAPEIANGNWLS